jgi:O-antigen/teichoic acid export membrane protein
VEAIWLMCPWCEEPLRGRSHGLYGRADLDVRRDTKRTSVVLIALAVVGGLGVAFLALQAFTLFTQEQAYQPMLFLAVGLLFLAGLSTLIVFLRSGGNPGAAGVSRVVVGTLAMAGGMMLLGICTGLALFVFLLAVCLSGNGSRL